MPNRLMSVMVEILKIEGGIGPLKLFKPRTRFSKFCRLPISLGISPAINDEHIEGFLDFSFF